MGSILAPIEWAVAWVMVGVHNGLTAIGMPDGPGFAWVLSVVGLTVSIRILLIPLFFRQIKAMRGMQTIQPELKKLQDKYKGKKDPASRRRQQEEMMALYKNAGTSPFASCLPLLLQMPIFFALFRTLNALQAIAVGERDPIGPIDANRAGEIESSELFGAPLSSQFIGAESLNVQIVTVILIIAMSTTAFLTQRQLTMKNMPPAAKESAMFKQQKIMLYIIPIIFAVTGVNFPIGVLIYWLISNLWSMGQQFYTIRRQPAPGSEAYTKMLERKNKKREAKGLPPLEPEPEKPSAPNVVPGERVQPNKRGPRGTTIVESADDAENAESSVPDDGLVRGKDGLTAEERAQRRYERRVEERRRAAEKRKRRNQQG